MATQDAKKAVDDFVDAQTEVQNSSKEILESLAASPLGDAVEFVGDAMAAGAQAGSTFFAGVTDPTQKNLLLEHLKAIGGDVFQRAIVEPTANRLNRLFAETANGSLHLFELGPRFFYDTISKQSRKLNRAIAQAQASGALLLIEATQYNTFHQTIDRSDLDGLDANKTAQFRTAAIAAVSEIENSIAASAAQGNNAFIAERVVSPQRQASTTASSTLNVPGADFPADGVRTGDFVQFVTNPDRLGDPGNNVSTEAALFTITAIPAPDTLTVTGTFPVQTDIEYRVIRPGGAKAAVAALEAICALFQDPIPIIAVLLQERVLEQLQIFERDLNNILNLKKEFETSFNNTLNANFVQPIKRTFATTSAVLTTEIEKMTALLGKPTFDKFTALNIVQDLCNRAGIIIEAFKRTPEGVKNEIEAEQNFGVYEPVTVSMAGLGNGPAEDFLEFAPKYRQVVSAVLIADIRNQLDARTTELAGEIATVQAWLLSQQGLVTGLPVVANLAASGATQLTQASGLDRLDNLLRCLNLKDFVGSSSNSATKAGDASQKLGECIQDLPPSEADKASALGSVRDDLISFERTQIITAEAIINESPESIGAVDSQTQQALNIQARTEALLA